MCGGLNEMDAERDLSIAKIVKTGEYFYKDFIMGNQMTINLVSSSVVMIRGP